MSRAKRELRTVVRRIKGGRHHGCVLVRGHCDECGRSTEQVVEAGSVTALAVCRRCGHGQRP